MVEPFEQYRPKLLALAYRMLGSATEAEDILQDAYLRYQGAQNQVIQSPQAFLTTVVTRLCLTELTSARAQRETYLGPWLPEPVLTEGPGEFIDPSQRASDHESISLAFLVLLENLTPSERAVFILREVFDYEYREIADILEKSEAACRQLFSRAKAYLAVNRPRYKSTPEDHRRLLERFIEAIEYGELSRLVDLLAENVTFWADGGGKVKGAATHPMHGRIAVAQFLLAVRQFAPEGYHHAVQVLNGMPALVLRTKEGMPFTVLSIEVNEDYIYEIRGVADPDKLRHL
ncbi:MAG TPA: RNA polymerase sigma-70 factor [Anaerolineales bacterium]|nr:RNA polymerase sigma-70 factor [Anaerolineales bacterium]